MVGALRFELRRPETTDLQSAPDTVTGLDTQILMLTRSCLLYDTEGIAVSNPC